MASIKEIARKANVAIATVDRVLHNRGRVSKDKEEKIRKLVKELRYKPNVFARNLKLKKAFVFGVVIPEKIDAKFWDLARNGINKAQKELESQGVKVKYLLYDPDSENSMASIEKNIIQKKIDGLVIAPLFHDAVQRIVSKTDVSIPYIFFVSKTPDSHCLSRIGQDAFQSGVVSARLMRLIVPEGGTIACIGRTPADFHIDERLRGFSSEFNADPEYRLLLYHWDMNNDEHDSAHLPGLLLNQMPALKGLFVPGGRAAAFADYFQQKKLPEKIRIIGYDLIEDNRRFLKNGGIDFIISQDPESQGYKSIYALYRYRVLKETPPKEITAPIDIVTSGNMEYYE